MDFTKFTTWIENIKNSIFPKLLQFCAVLEVVFYTTLPTIIYILWSAFDKSIDFRETIEEKWYIHGELLLYSIALLSSAYTTVKVYTNKKMSLNIIFIILVSVSYAIIVNKKTDEIRVDVLLFSSAATFVIGICYTWYAMSLINKVQGSFQERDKKASDKLQNELEYE